MPDVYTEFLDTVIRGDPESREQFRVVHNKREAGRQVFVLRQRLGLSCGGFVRVLGLADPAEVEDLELGNFPESGLEKLLEIRNAVKQYQLRLADISGRLCNIREKLRMSRENLAEFSGLPVETIKNLEETHYDGDWDEAIEKINVAFTAWVTEVLAPTYKTEPPRDYQVQPKAVNA